MKLRIFIATLALIVVQTSIAQTETKTVYPVTVSFQSVCCGVPTDSSIRSFITSFKKKYKIKTITGYHIGPMGREGEYYLGFRLSELSKKQAAAFISKIKYIKKLTSDKGLLSFKEKLEINTASISQRATIKEVVF